MIQWVMFVTPVVLAALWSMLLVSFFWAGLGAAFTSTIAIFALSHFSGSLIAGDFWFSVGASAVFCSLTAATCWSIGYVSTARSVRGVL